GKPRAARTSLQALAADLGDATLIVAGRPEGAPEPWPGFGTLQLQPLSEREQERLLRNLGVSESLIQSQLPQMRAHTRLRELVSRPLLLTLAALVLRADGVLPRKRAQLYERAITILLNRHELNPDAPEDVVRAPDDTLAALRSLAPRLLRQGEGPWTREVCVELLREDRAVMERLRETWPMSTALEFLKESGRTLGLLTPQAGGLRYGFPHRTLGEYLTSLGLVEDAAARSSAVEEALRHPARWAEVLALTVSQLPPAEADGLVRALVDAGEAGRGALYRVLASAEGLRPETVREVLKMEAGWEEEQLEARKKVIEEIPALVNDLAVAVGLLEQVARSTTCGHNLFWVREVLRRIECGEVASVVLDGSVEDAKREAKEAADNLLSHLSTEKRAELLAMLKPWWRTISAGSFDMGSDDDDEKPIHRVTFTSGFLMLGVPVTWAMYRLFDPDHDAARDDFGGKLPPDVQDEVPVYNVSWFASVMFAEWVGARLPLEPEWEYACRGRTKTRFWSGDTDEDLARVGWTNDARFEGGNAQWHPHPVAEKPKNAWGLHDVHGNVWEWCADDGGDYAARADGLSVDPRRVTFAVGGRPPELAVSVNGDASRVLRGGSWSDWLLFARSTYRKWDEPSSTNRNIGFRIVRCPPDPP
ncbi:SUMF1/EgtB/PvdO family nonheme iron enzyme, partial [Myxococcota bacterium]|nr:SUMF1/EgtB/PvdO family nonheme iron enzyme [Myxococcota bacterium]